MAPMALSDSEVTTCSKSCLKNYETLKKQYDDLRIELNQSEFNLANYKRGLASMEERLVFYKKNEGLFAPPTIDLSSSGLEEFQQPEFEGYGLRANKSVCENSSNETKKNSDAPLIEEWISNNEDEVESPVVVEKKTVVLAIPKFDVVRPKQQEKPVRKIVRPKAVVNAVRTNRVNAIKASAFGFGDLSNLIGNPETELEDLVRLNRPEDKKLMLIEMLVNIKLMLIEKINADEKIITQD
ncbi:hypothetical protein Tco_0460848 [Tanacetum coccineum]